MLYFTLEYSTLYKKVSIKQIFIQGRGLDLTHSRIIVWRGCFDFQGLNIAHALFALWFSIPSSSRLAEPIQLESIDNITHRLFNGILRIHVDKFREAAKKLFF